METQKTIDFKFTPSTERDKVRLNEKNSHSLERVCFSDLPIGSVLYIKGYHDSARYYIRVVEIDGERRVKIWTSIYDDSCLLGFPETLGSLDDMRPFDTRGLHPGEFTVGKPIQFPYFRGDGNGLLPVHDRGNSWVDTVREIRLYNPELDKDDS